MARYFTKEQFTKDLDLNRIDEVLNRLYKEEDITPDQLHPIEFFVMSNEIDKLDEYEEILVGMGIEVDTVEEYGDGCEMVAITEPMKMDAETLKAWYQKLWALGFEHDCKLDGWHVLLD